MDKEGQTIDFLLTPQRDRDAAEAFLCKAIRTQGLPEKITIDKSGAQYGSDPALPQDAQDRDCHSSLEISH